MVTLVVASVLATSVASCSSPGPRATDGEVPDVFLSTRDQTGHELVKTEQFVVPVGTAIAIEGLEIAAPDCALTEQQGIILRQAFNALEEITENTVGDTVAARVAESKQMTMDVRGAVTSNARLAKADLCARRVMGAFTGAGTPPWRLRAVAAKVRRRGAAAALPDSVVVVDFVRTK